jgi:type IV pilus assembly protein PilX
MRTRSRNHLSGVISVERGVSLIITMIMLVIIGLTASAAMRGSISSERVVNNMRAEALAQQYAEAGLAYCESQLNLPTASRIAALQDASLTTVAVGGTPTWQSAGTWVGGASSQIVVPITRVQSVDSSFTPRPPECFVELQLLPDTKTAILITARGFSPDYSADAGSGRTLTGSVVWLQSLLALN